MRKYQGIEDRIFDLYLYDPDEGSEAEEEEASLVTPKFPMLASNNLAKKISGNYNPFLIQDTTEAMFYKIVCSRMIAADPDLKEHRRDLEDYETGGPKNSRADVSDYLRNMAKNTLEPGEYYVKAGKKTYLYMKVSKYVESEDNKNRRYYDDDCMVHFDIWIIGKNWKEVFDSIVAEKEKFVKESEKSLSDYFIGYSGNSDDSYGSTKKTVFKSFDSLVMRDKDKVIKYIDNWVENIPYFYKKYNMISKLSIILYGEPGTGKSTFCQSLAKYLNIHRIMPISPNTFETTSNVDSGFGELVPVIYSIDDIDCVCKARTDEKASKSDSLAMANVLAFLDNPPTFFFKAKDGLMYPVSICVATTNYYDKLDPAVKRYGRFDLHIQMNEFDEELAREMCAVYDLKLEDVISKEELEAKPFKYSPAKLQAMCLANIDKRMKEFKQ